MVQVSFVRSELSQQLQMSAFHPTHPEYPTPLNTAPTDMTQHLNNQPPMEQPFLKLGVQFCDFFNQRGVVVNFLILFTHNVFITWHREINKGPPPSDPVQRGNVWTIMF